MKIIPMFIVIIFSFIFLVGCIPLETSIKKITPDTLVYANYSSGDYSLNIVKPDTFELIDKVKLMKGWGERIFKDKQGKIWCPIYYKPDMTNAENKVIIIDPKTGGFNKVTVGNHPRDIFFINEKAYVLCEEDGENPTIYQIDSNLNPAKWMTVQHGGLIFGAQSDGQNIYWSSLRCHDDPELDYPQLVKVNENKSVVKKRIVDHYEGMNNLYYLNNKLYLGLEDTKGTFVEFDAVTLEFLRYFPYHEMVGDIVAIGEQQLAITNFSNRMSKGSTITIIDLKDGKISKSFNAKNLAERLSFVDDSLFVGDNYNMKLQKFNLNGESLNTYEIPTQTTNILSMN